MKKKKSSDPATAISKLRDKKTENKPGWTFLTNHTHVLLCLYRAPEMTLREVAALVGITERMVQRIVAELVESNYLKVTKIGRKNTYEIREEMQLRHPLESHRRIVELLDHLKKGASPI
jgi:DNA-binding MarR family transcriptional regulator